MGHANLYAAQFSAPLIWAAGCQAEIDISRDGINGGDLFQFIQDTLLADITGMEDMLYAIKGVEDVAIEIAVGI